MCLRRQAYIGQILVEPSFKGGCQVLQASVNNWEGEATGGKSKFWAVNCKILPTSVLCTAIQLGQQHVQKYIYIYPESQ